MNKSPRARAKMPAHHQFPPPPPGDGVTSNADGDFYEDHVRQLRHRLTGRYIPGPGGPKRKRPE